MYTLEQIGEFYKDMGLTSLSIKDGDFEISLSSQQNYVAAPVMPAMPAPAQTVAAAMQQAPVQMAAPAEEGLLTICSPMVGIYGGSDQLKVGDVVKKGEVVGTIEAMKMLNDITSNYDGIVAEICAAKGDMVEYNQVLIKLRSM